MPADQCRVGLELCPAYHKPDGVTHLRGQSQSDGIRLIGSRQEVRPKPEKGQGWYVGGTYHDQVRGLGQRDKELSPHPLPI